MFAALLATTAARPMISSSRRQTGGVGSALVVHSTTWRFPSRSALRATPPSAESQLRKYPRSSADYGDPDAPRRRSPRFLAAHVCFSPVATRQPRRPRIHVLDAAQTPQRVSEYVVKLSTASAVLEDERGGRYAAHLEVEAALAASGVSSRLRPNLFFQMPLAAACSAWRWIERRVRARFCHRAHRGHRLPRCCRRRRRAARLRRRHAARRLHLPADRTGSGDAGRRSRAKALADARRACHHHGLRAEAKLRRCDAGPAAAGGGEPRQLLEVLAERCRETTPHVEALSSRPPTSLAAFVAEQRVRDFLAAG